MSRAAAGRVLAGLLLCAALAGCGSFLHRAAGNGFGATGSAGSGAVGPGVDGGTAGGALPYDVSGLLQPKAGKFLGVEAPGAPGSLAPVQRFAASIGRKPNLIGQYVAWNTPFPAQPVARAWSYGALSYLAWEPYSVSVQSIADGHSDGYVTQFAKAVRALNDPVALSFGHEMNGFWYPWGTTHTTPAEFVAAWRRIHNLFAQAGASNVIWVWNPNDIFPVPQIQLKPYYPGNAYVDWIGVTGYFSTTGPHTYAQLYAPTIAEVRSFTSKPFIIAETSIETGPSEVLCARQLILRTVMAHPRMLGLIWFDYDKNNVDWRVESRPIVESAVRTDLSGFAVPRQAAMSRRDASQAPPGRPVRPARPTQTRRAYRPFSRPEADTVMLPPVTADPGGGGPGEPGQRPPGGGPPGGRPGGPSRRGPSGRGPARPRIRSSGPGSWSARAAGAASGSAARSRRRARAGSG